MRMQTQARFFLMRLAWRLVWLPALAFAVPAYADARVETASPAPQAAMRFFPLDEVRTYRGSVRHPPRSASSERRFFPLSASRPAQGNAARSADAPLPSPAEKNTRAVTKPLPETQARHILSLFSESE